MSKKKKLENLQEEIIKNTTLPLRESNLVFGEGNIDSPVVFIGEAPGKNEDIQKRPFVGRGGQLLNKVLEQVGMKRESVYITNIVKRRPPDNRDPLPEEIAAYKPYLSKQIEILNPKIIVPLGRFSMNYFLPDAKITRDQGKIFVVDGKLIMPVFHPAAALRATGVLEEFRKSLRKLPVLTKKADELLEEASKKKVAIEESEPK